MDSLPVKPEGDTRLKAIHVFSLVEIVDMDFFLDDTRIEFIHCCLIRIIQKMSLIYLNCDVMKRSLKQLGEGGARNQPLNRLLATTTTVNSYSLLNLNKATSWY